MSLRDHLFYEEPGITLYCGDCREVLPLLEPVSALITDPPYGLDFDYGENGHDDSPHRYEDIVESINLAERLVLDGWCVVFQSSTTWREWATRFPRAERLIALLKPFVQMNRAHPAHATDYALAWKIGQRQSREDWHQPGFRDWFRCSPQDLRSPIGHPCPRPPDGCRYLVGGFCPPNGMALDPFAGSGTILEAAKSINRRAIGIEIEPRYCEIAVKRLRQEVLSFGKRTR